MIVRGYFYQVLSHDLIFRLEIKVVRHEKGIARREVL